MSEKYPSSNSTGSFSTTTPKRAVFQEAKTYYVNYVEGLEASAADRLEMNKELEAAAAKVLRISLNRKKLLRRAHDMLEIGMPHLIELIEEIAEELGDD